MSEQTPEQVEPAEAPAENEGDLDETGEHEPVPVEPVEETPEVADAEPEDEPDLDAAE